MKEPTLAGGKKVDEGFTYSSEINNDWFSKMDLKNWISKNKNILGMN